MATWPHEQDPFDAPGGRDPAVWLSAYVDGELGDEDRARVEAWLARDPRARAEVEAQRRLRGWCQRAAVPEPGGEAWDGVLARVEAALRPPAALRSGRGARRWVAGLSAAAAVLLALWLAREPADPRVAPDGPSDGGPTETLEVASDADIVIHHMDPDDAERGAVVVGGLPGAELLDPKPGEQFQVAAPGDVFIICMDGSDTTALVVGAPPVSGALVLASSADVEVHNMAPHPADDVRPYLHAPQGAPPMVLPPGMANPLPRPPFPPEGEGPK